jgi:hypothetical protein
MKAKDRAQAATNPPATEPATKSRFGDFATVKSKPKK